MTVQLGRPWDRQPNEPPKAFHAFCHFRDLPVSKRSLDRAYSLHRVACGTGNDPETIPHPLFEATKCWKTWKRAWDWAPRVAAHDADIAEQQRFTHIGGIEEMNAIHVGLATAMTNQIVAKLNDMVQAAGRQTARGCFAHQIAHRGPRQVPWSNSPTYPPARASLQHWCRARRLGRKMAVDMAWCV